jgi:hypothetical protein
LTYSGEEWARGPEGGSLEACEAKLSFQHYPNREKESWHSCGRALSFRFAHKEKERKLQHLHEPTTSNDIKFKRKKSVIK